MCTAELQEILGNGLCLKKFTANGVKCLLAASHPRQELRRPVDAIPEFPCAGECLTRLGGREAHHRDKNGASGALHLHFAAVSRCTGRELCDLPQCLVKHHHGLGQCRAGD
jgi:hypothetical protein